MIYTLKNKETGPKNVTLFIPQNLPVLFMIQSHQGEIKQEVSQWHSEFDNGTIEALSIIEPSLEISAKKEILPITSSHLCLFILILKSMFLSLSSLHLIATLCFYQDKMEKPLRRAC